jgi:hypothetical protein
MNQHPLTDRQRIALCAGLLDLMELGYVAELARLVAGRGDDEQLPGLAVVMATCARAERLDLPERLLRDESEPSGAERLRGLDQAFASATAQMLAEAKDGGRWEGIEIEMEEGVPMTPAELAEAVALHTGARANAVWLEDHDPAAILGPETAGPVGAAADRLLWAAAETIALRWLLYLAEQPQRPGSLQEWRQALHAHVYQHFDEVYREALAG